MGVSKGEQGSEEILQEGFGLSPGGERAGYRVECLLENFAKARRVMRSGFGETRRSGGDLGSRQVPGMGSEKLDHVMVPLDRF